MSNTAIPPSPIVISSPTGNSSLPIIELGLDDVLSNRKQVRSRRGSKRRLTSDCSFGNYQSHLPFTAWEFFHAAKKTELTTSFSASDVDRWALLYAAEYSRFFQWDTDNLRRIDRQIYALEDFAESGFAGRIGEACAYLTMLSKGYVYWDRIASLWNRAAIESGMTHSEQVKSAEIVSNRIKSPRPDQEPDFVFENSQGEIALMEAKGSFVHPAYDNPRCKSDLRAALKQLDAWSGMIDPTPSKSYAIGTYFRDQSDSTGDPSLILYVDPPGTLDENVPTVRFNSDLVRRHNYGAWLIGMGLAESGNSLRQGIEVGLPEQELPVISIGNREFVVRVEGISIDGRATRWGPSFIHWLDLWHWSNQFDDHDWWQYLRHLRGVRVQLMGLELETARLVEKSLVNPASLPLMNRESRSAVLSTEQNFGGFYGSIFPDGTLCGQVNSNLASGIRTESFRM